MGRKEITKWDIYYGEQIIGQVQADTFEEARDKGVKHARMVNHDLMANQVYAIRKTRKRPTTLLRWSTQRDKDEAKRWAERLQMSLNEYIVNAIAEWNEYYREKAADD